METQPDFTVAQLVALLQWSISTAVTMMLAGETATKILVTVASAALGIGLVWADSRIREARNKVRCASITAGLGDPADKSSGAQVPDGGVIPT